MTTKNSKKAFDLGRDTMWVADPNELCIIGGKSMKADERGPLDTDDGDEHHLYDRRILKPLNDEFKDDIFAHGVDTPITITKIDGITVVVAGRRRVRAARLANKRRVEQSLPLVKIRCAVKRDTMLGLLGTMIRENEGRDDDDVTAKIEKLKRYLNFGATVELASADFNVGLQTIKNWLAYEDNAVNATKKAVESGKISQTNGAALARIKDPEQQKKALDEVIVNTANGHTPRRAVQLAAKNAGTAHVVGVNDKKTQRKFLEVIQHMPHPGASDKTMAYWEGSENMLKLILGEEDVDQRLIGKLEEVYALLKNEKRAAAKGGGTRKKKAAKNEDATE